jgi:hypothetical protein
VPQLVRWFTVLSFLTLDIDQDVANANRFAVNFQRTVLPDIRATIASGDSIGHLNFLDWIVVPICDIPTRTQSIRHANRGEPTILVYFSTQGDSAGGDGSVSTAYPLSRSVMDYMASVPTETVRSVGLGSTAVPLIKDNIVGILE